MSRTTKLLLVIALLALLGIIWRWREIGDELVLAFEALFEKSS